MSELDGMRIFSKNDLSQLITFNDRGQLIPFNDRGQLKYPLMSLFSDNTLLMNLRSELNTL